MLINNPQTNLEFLDSKLNLQNQLFEQMLYNCLMPILLGTMPFMKGILCYQPVLGIRNVSTSVLSQLSYSFPGSSAGKESAYNAGDPGSIPRSGRSPEERIGYPLQYYDLENSMNCIVHGITKSWTLLSDFHFTKLPYQYFYCRKVDILNV